MLPVKRLMKCVTMTTCLLILGWLPSTRLASWHAYMVWVKDFIPWPRHNSCRKGVFGNVSSSHGCLDVSYRSWDKSKNSCPCRTRTFPNEVHHQTLGITQPMASCFPAPDNAHHWEMCKFHTGMGSCYNSYWRYHQMRSRRLWLFMKASFLQFVFVSVFVFFWEDWSDRRWISWACHVISLTTWRWQNNSHERQLLVRYKGVLLGLQPQCYSCVRHLSSVIYGSGLMHLLNQYFHHFHRFSPH